MESEDSLPYPQDDDGICILQINLGRNYTAKTLIVM
jgi:hypothetical protein